MERNYGIDLLRIVSILFVVILHEGSHGGALSTGGGAALLVNCFALCAVDCFVLISGYVMFGSHYKTSRLMSLWAECFFYSIAITGVFLAIGKVPLASFALSLFPVTTGVWWFFSQYFGLMLIAPLLNRGLRALGEKPCRALAIALVLFLSVLPFIFQVDPFKLNRGYSMAWFVVLYVIGGILKRTDFAACKPALFWGACYAVVCIALFALEFCVAHSGEPVEYARNAHDIAVRYSSPFVFGSALLLFCCFSRVKVGLVPAKVIKFFTTSVFAIYLISDHALMREQFMKDAFRFVGGFGPLETMVVLVGVSVMIGIGLVFVDKLRALLFEALGVNRAVKRISDALDKRISPIV